MKKLKILLLVLLTSINWTAYSIGYIPTDTLKQDTTQLLSAPIWKWNRIMKEITLYRACDSLSTQQAAELVTSRAHIQSLTHSLALSREANRLTELEKEAWWERYNIKDKQNEVAHKETRRVKKQRNGAVLIAIAVTIFAISQ